MAKRTAAKLKGDEASLFQEPPKPAVAPAAQPKQAVVIHDAKAKAAKPPAKSKPARKAEIIGGDTASVLALIERLAINPAVDPTKLEKIIALQERIMDRNSRAAFDAAMVDMQPHLPVVTRSGRIIVKEKDAQGKRTGEETQNTPYAKWETMVPLIKPVLHEYGFALTHRTSTAPDGKVRVTAVLKGHGFTDDSCYMDLALDTTGSKNNAQAVASSISYGKRHTASAVLNLVTKDEDNDGRSAGPPVTVGDSLNDDECTQLIDLCDAVGCDKQKLIAFLNEKRPKGHPVATGIGTLPRSRFDEAVAACRSYEANKKAREADKGKSA